MPNERNNYDLRSEEVQSILTAIPSWTTRSGSALVCMLVVFFLIISWFIKYPDVIEAPGVLTTLEPPQKEYAKHSGKLQHLLVKNNQKVVPSTNLAVIENSANYNDVLFLKQIVDSISVNKKDFSFPVDEVPVLFLGDIESAYSTFENNYVLYDLNKRNNPFISEKASHVNTSSELKVRLKALQNQKTIEQNELNFQKKDVNRYSELYNKGVVSEQEYEAKQISFMRAERSYKSTLSSISKLKEIIGNTKNDFDVKKSTSVTNEIKLLKNVIQSFNQLKKAIYDWEYNYVLKSNITGKVSFLNIWSVNQYVNSGDHMFTIIPNTNNSYIAKLQVPMFNSGKIKLGQNVNIRLNNYPETEFGVLEGIVEQISETTNKDGHYIVDVSLPKILKTSYNKELSFKHEMSGRAEIITDNLRLTDRFFGEFKKILN